MKIGIITFHAAHNYGAVLQAYALQTYLKKLGHDPFFINYDYMFEGFRYGLSRWIGRTPRQTARLLERHLTGWPFAAFRKNYLNIGSTKYKDIGHLLSGPPKADAYICGSDQIWNPAHARSESDERASWLDFGDDTVRRIAYAASFGSNDLDQAICARWSNYAKRFYAISVRERDGVDLVRKLGRQDAVWVPDPTLLLDSADYDAIQPKQITANRPYLFAFRLINDSVNTITTAASTALKITSLDGSIGSRRAFYQGGFKGPSGWLWRIQHSRLVVTDSYHCMAFSLIFHRPFIVALRVDAGSPRNGRIKSLLTLLGLESRCVEGVSVSQIEHLCNEEINWDHVDNALGEYRKIGHRFLCDALS
jgi:hypothetical protein